MAAKSIDMPCSPSTIMVLLNSPVLLQEWPPVPANNGTCAESPRKRKRSDDSESLPADVQPRAKQQLISFGRGEPPAQLQQQTDFSMQSLDVPVQKPEQKPHEDYGGGSTDPQYVPRDAEPHMQHSEVLRTAMQRSAEAPPAEASAETCRVQHLDDDALYAFSSEVAAAQPDQAARRETQVPAAAAKEEAVPASFAALPSFGLKPDAPAALPLDRHPLRTFGQASLPETQDMAAAAPEEAAPVSSAAAAAAEAPPDEPAAFSQGWGIFTKPKPAAHRDPRQQPRDSRPKPQRGRNGRGRGARHGSAGRNRNAEAPAWHAYDRADPGMGGSTAAFGGPAEEVGNAEGTAWQLKEEGMPADWAASGQTEDLRDDNVTEQPGRCV